MNFAPNAHLVRPPPVVLQFATNERLGMDEPFRLAKFNAPPFEQRVFDYAKLLLKASVVILRDGDGATLVLYLTFEIRPATITCQK